MRAKHILSLFITSLITGTLIRLIGLGQIPQMFDGDETAFGYEAFAVGNWARDEYGTILPVYFPSIGDFKYPSYVYLSVPWVKLFGLTEFATRFTSALAGILAIAFIFAAAYLLFSDPIVALSAGWLLALSPWHIWMSRRALEANLGVTMLLGGITLTLYWLKTKNSKFWPALLVMATVGIFSYSGIRMLTLAASAILILWAIFKRRSKILTIWLLIAVATGVSFMSFASRARGEKIRFGNSDQISSIIQSVLVSAHEDGIASSPLPVVLSRALHNKLFYLAGSFAQRFIAHFDPTWWLTTGETRDRYVIPGMGLVSYAEMGLILIGALYLIKHRSRHTLLLVLWLAISALPSVLTTEPPHSVRFAFAIPAVILLAAVGLRQLAKFKWLFVLCILIVIVNFFYFLHQYVIHQTYHQPWHLEAVIHQLPPLIAKYQSHYAATIIPGDPYIFFLFANRTSPAKFLSSSTISTTRFDWDRVNTFGQIIFKSPGPCPKLGKARVLYVCESAEVPVNAKVLEVVRYADSVPAYTLIEFLPLSQVKVGGSLPQGLNWMKETDLRFGSEGLLPDTYPTYWL